MVSRERATKKSSPDSLEAILSKDSLSPAETAALRSAVAELDFDPNRNPELTRKILLTNDNLSNRIICSHPSLASELKLMVIERGLSGDREALFRPEENLQRAAIERGDPELLAILTEHPRLTPELQEPLLDKCFVFEKKRYSYREIYDDSTIHFGVINKLIRHPGYDRRLDDQLAANLLQTQQAEANYGMIHSYNHYLAGSKVMLEIADSPHLARNTWQNLTEVTLKKATILSCSRAGRSKQEREAIDKMLDLVLDTLVELLNSPVLAGYLRDNPSLRLEEAAKGRSVSDYGDIMFGDLRNVLSNLSRQHKRAFEQLDSARRSILPKSWRYILFDRVE